MDSSEDEDVFACGRCKQEFSSIKVFKQHKDSKVCKKSGSKNQSSNLADNSKTSQPQSIPTGYGGLHTTEIPGNANTVDFSSVYDGDKKVEDVCIAPLQSEANLSSDPFQVGLNHKDEGGYNSFLANQNNNSQNVVQTNPEVNSSTLEAAVINCQFCSTAVGEGSALKDHLKTAHSISSEQVAQVALSMTQKRHKRKQAQSIMCEPCQRPFKTQGSYKTHCRTKKHQERLAQGDDALNHRSISCDTSSLQLEEAVENNDGEDQRISSVNASKSSAEQAIQSLPSGRSEQKLPVGRQRGRPKRKNSFGKTCPHCSQELDSPAELVKHIRDEHPGRGNRARKIPDRLMNQISDEGEFQNEGDDEDDGNEMDSTSSKEVEVKKDDPKRKSKRARKEVPEKCDICGISVSAQSYSVHRRRCKNRSKYKCQLCHHQSRERYDFNIHIDHHKVWVEVDSSDKEDVDGAVEILGNLSDENSKSSNNNEDDTTLSEADLAAIGLMPRNKAVEYFCKLTGTVEHSYASTNPKSRNAEDARKPDVGSSDKKGSTGSTLKCHKCERWFHRSILPTHMYKIHRMKKRFQCRNADCLKVFQTIDEFAEHVKSHPDDTMFCCGCMNCKKDKKDEVEEYNAAVKRWKMRSYYKTLVYHCEKCWMRFPSQASLDRHLQSDSHHYPCTVCGKIQPSKRQLRTHMWSHQEKKEYLCEHCGRGFRTPRDLRKHVVSHGDERPFECEKCGKGFLFKNKLDRHMTTVHSAIKPYVCDHPGCGKAFTRKDKLKDHSYTHNDSPPFVCSYCPKGFYRKDNLTDHEVYHTKRYRYTCNMCKKGFMRPKSLRQHFAIEHPVSYRIDVSAIVDPEKVEEREDVEKNLQIVEVSLSKEPTPPSQLAASSESSAGQPSKSTEEAPTLTPQSSLPVQDEENPKSIGQSLWNAQQISQQVNQLIQSMQSQADNVNNPLMKVEVGPDFAHLLPQAVHHQQHHPQQLLAEQNNPEQLRYNQQKLEQVTRQIQVVTQQLAQQLTQQLIHQQIQPQVQPNLMQPEPQHQPPPINHQTQHHLGHHPTQHTSQHNMPALTSHQMTHLLHPQQAQHMAYTISTIHDHGSSVPRM